MAVGPSPNIRQIALKYSGLFWYEEFQNLCGSFFLCSLQLVSGAEAVQGLEMGHEELTKIS
jgi:hypothetical protein